MFHYSSVLYGNKISTNFMVIDRHIYQTARGVHTGKMTNYRWGESWQCMDTISWYGSPIMFYYAADMCEMWGKQWWNFVFSLFSALVFQHWMEDIAPPSDSPLVSQALVFPSKCQLVGTATRVCDLQCIESQLLDQLFGLLQPFPVSKSNPRYMYMYINYSSKKKKKDVHVHWAWS